MLIYYMNNNIYIIVIVFLCFFVFFRKIPITEGNTKSKKAKKAKKVASVLSGNKASCDVNLINPTYTFSSHIKTPSTLHMSTKSKSINKNLSGLSAYTDILTKGKSKATKRKKALGGRYFENKGLTCYAYDKTTDKCTKQTSTCYTNDVPSDTGDQGLIPGLIADLNILNGMINISSSTPCTSKEKYPACTEVVLDYATDDCIGYGKSYLLNSDVNKLDKSLFYAGKTNVYADAQGGEYPNLTEGYSDETCSPLDSSSSMDGFTTIESQDNYTIAVDSTDKYKQYFTNITKKDPIKQLFIMIVGVGGLYLLHQLMYPKKRR
jgi:hypothetical protein